MEIRAVDHGCASGAANVEPSGSVVVGGVLHHLPCSPFGVNPVDDASTLATEILGQKVVHGLNAEGFDGKDNHGWSLSCVEPC